MYVDFIKLRETLYVPHIIICRLLTSPFLFPFVFSLLDLSIFLWPHDWPPESLKLQSSSLCTICPSTSWDSIKIFSETVHLRVISTSRIRNGKKPMLGQVVTILILLNNILYDSDLNYIDLLIFLQFSLKVLGTSHNHKGTLCQDWLKESWTLTW